MAFIDADKTNYLNYYDRWLQRVRRSGPILFDNTLWGEAVADPQNRDDDTSALRELNDRLLADQRISLSLMPIGDGLTLGRVRLGPAAPGSCLDRNPLHRIRLVHGTVTQLARPLYLVIY
jgi:hypothetical protein